MKKILVAVLFAICGVGCASTQYHNGRDGVTLANTDAIKVYPMQAEVRVGNVVSGVAECEKWFGIFKKEPEKQTYGLPLQSEQGNFAPNACTRGAVYDAISKGNADTIIAPRYLAVKKKELCILGIKSLCLHEVDQIIVTGYKGTFTNIKSMPEDLVNFKWKAEILNNNK